MERIPENTALRQVLTLESFERFGRGQSNLSLQRPGQASGPAATFQSRFRFRRTRDPGSGSFEFLTGDGVARHHQAAARSKREDVCAHAFELRVGHFDQLHAFFQEPLSKRDRQERRRDMGQTAIHRADDRHEIEDIVGTAPVGQGDGDELVDAVTEKAWSRAIPASFVR